MENNSIPIVIQPKDYLMYSRNEQQVEVILPPNLSNQVVIVRVDNVNAPTTKTTEAVHNEPVQLKDSSPISERIPSIILHGRLMKGNGVWCITDESNFNCYETGQLDMNNK